MSDKQNHHFLSQCYLKRFTELGNKDSQLTCIDLKKKNCFSTIPKKIACIGDFNRIEIEKFDPYDLENKLALLEEVADKAISNIENRDNFYGENKKYVLNLMALFVIRNPYRRACWDDMIDHVSKIALSYIASAKVGSKVNEFEVTKEIKDFINEGKFKCTATRNQHINLELHTLDIIIKLLTKRQWTLMLAPDDLHFITCDFPVALLWKNPEKYVASPGFACADTQVFFPLSQKVALIGDFEGENEIVIATQEIVAGINTNILRSAKRFIYAPQEKFWFLHSSGRLSSDLDLFIR